MNEPSMSQDSTEPNPAGANMSAKPQQDRKSRAGWLAALFVVALVGWMGSGYYYPAETVEADKSIAEKLEPFAVEAIQSTAEPVTRFVAVEGQAAPDRMTPVRAKVGGTVESIAARKGEFLDKGDLIARIALDDRSAQIAQAEAELARRQGEYDRVSGLAQRGYATRAEVEAAEAELADAQASLAAIQQTAGDTAIRAPITGVLDGFDLDLGEFVEPGAEVGTQVDNDPLTIDVEIAQQNVGRVQVGQKASVSFITGETREGEVTYVAANADAATRTFPVEIRVPNPERDIPAGISAQVRIPTGETPAHFVSAALLALGPDGDLGIKAVDGNETVRFHPVELVRAESDGIWVSGLPETLQIVSVGQGFVAEGEKVRVIPASESGGEPGTIAEPVAGTPVAELAGDTDGFFAEAAAAERSGPGGSDGGDSRRQDAKVSTASSGAAEGSSVQDADGELLRTASSAEWSVRALQERLEELGYDPGTVDGVLGEATREAIRRFQADRGLAVTGAIDRSLATALLTAASPAGAQ